MSRVYGDDVELTSADASLVKGMIKRGDKNEAIASYFGVNQRAISHIRSGKKFSEVGAATQLQLPPPGPYGVDPVYVHFYRTMAKVNSLWDDKRLGEAKALLEKSLLDPALVGDLEDADKIFADLTRDEFGLLKIEFD